jgi:aminoglycoside phosphotransferase (APT) family kinase protein
VNESVDTKPVRASEALDWGSLDRYIRPRLTEVLGRNCPSSASLSVEQFPGGHSNLTYLLRFADLEVVLRRPPLGPVAPKAHDMAREYRILAAVNPVYPLAPRPILLCEDASIIGSTFYLMERRHGLVVRTAEPPQLKDRPDERRRASVAMVHALAQLHNVDIEANELVALGKPIGFAERQVSGWISRWHGSQTSELPELDQLAAWLVEHLPPETPRHTLVHGDFKLDNAMFDASDIGRLVAVFDWEMSTVGDPLVDLGILLCYWIHSTSSPGPSDSVAAVTGHPGWFNRSELLEQYAAQTNFDLSGLRFYEVFAVFKLAIVLQQIFYRYHRGQTDDPRFAALDKRVEWLAQLATRLVAHA